MKVRQVGGDRAKRARFLAITEVFFFRFSKLYISLVGSTQPTNAWVQEALHPGERFPWFESGVMKAWS
jgi:hypothetical protein